MASARWRKKVLPLNEWGKLQETFGDHQMETGAPEDLAMFMKKVHGYTEAEIYIVGPGTEKIERFSPGEWEDSEAPSGPGVVLLVGRDDPWSYFGIEKPQR